MTEGTCAIEGCTRRRYRREWCSAHYNRWIKTGETGPLDIRAWGRKRCSVGGCDKPHYGNGYCNMHTQRLRVHGTVELPSRDENLCTFQGCGLLAINQGLCNGHAIQRKDGKQLTPLQRRRRSDIRDGQGRKQCSGCDEWKVPADFYPRSERHRDGLSTYCRRCDRDRALASRYGITLAEYEALLQAQGGGCAICAEDPGDGPALAVDHDHTCCPGKRACSQCIRGLLCGDCNRALGMFRDDVARLESAIGYLKNGGTKHG
jgi:hypothetical protein